MFRCLAPGHDSIGHGSNGRVEEPEPLAEVRLDRQLLLELRLQLQLAGVVSLLLLAGRDERPPRPRLEPVDPIDGMVAAPRAAVEAERGGEELAAEAVLLELGGEGVDARDLIVELGVADDHPLEAERVRLAVDRRAGSAGDTAQKLLRLVLGLAELTCRHGLEDESGVAGRLQRALRVERDGRGREGEEPVGRGLLQLLAAEENVAEPGQDSGAASSTGSAPAAGCAPVAPGAGSASPAEISFAPLPEPTSALSFASSSSTCEAEEICASSRSSCVWSPAVKSSSAPLEVSSSIAAARACISSVLSFARWIARPVSFMCCPIPVAASPTLTWASAAEYWAFRTSFCDRKDSIRVSSCCWAETSLSCSSSRCFTWESMSCSCCCATVLRSRA